MTERPKAFMGEYGMYWYPSEPSEAIISVSRMAEYRGRSVLRIIARHAGQDTDDAAILEVTVSKKGQAIRTYPVQGNVGQGDC